MLLRQPIRNAVLASLVLAAGVFAGAEKRAAAQPNTIGWAPSREEAVMVEGFPASMLPQDSALGRSLMAKRPQGLSRPAPGRRVYMTDSQTGTEPLPSISGAPASPDGLPVPQEMYYDEGVPNDGYVNGGYGDPRCCGPCGPGLCGSAGWGGWGACMWVPICVFIPRPPLDGLEIFSGVQGFTGPVNRGGSGSFGFHEGFNWGIPLFGFLATQWGVNWTQSNFDGNYLTPDQRNQIFLTGGLYRRVDWGLQGGLVVDYLHEGWDFSADLVQLRGELSWLWCGRNEAGFWFTSGVHDANNVLIRQPVIANNGASLRFASSTATVAVNDIYAFFFRRQFACGGQGRMFGGFTGEGQGLVGGDAALPLNPNWSLRSNFIYAVPSGNNTTTDPRFERESWNVGISLVWTPCPRSAGCPNYNRPLFNVADNGSFLTRLLR